MITQEVPKVRSRFNLGPRVYGTENNLPSKTQQQFAEECNINKIMERYHRTGVMVDPSKISRRQAIFGDFSSFDFVKAQQSIAEANTAFEELPAALRKRFGNSTEKLIAFMENPNNKEEAIELGLINKPNAKIQKPVEIPVKALETTQVVENKKDDDKKSA